MTSRRLIERAIELHADVLAAFPNVVGVGLSDTVDDDRPGAERSLAVGVYVTKKKSAAELEDGDLLPGFVEIDDRGDMVRVPVEVIEMGEFHLEGLGSQDAEIPRNEGDDGSTFSAQ
ncbi:MAG: hypothetical protein WA964_15900 [Ilumatobacter sp.]|uniref:hypothetical protein n=1 Tax=Ilumatobacter sp. TaxID=1967498 RepID=UPI003C775214